ncbi:MAG: hypothetical protein ACI4SB_05725 [Acutalibacteraceae bacterium]
MDSEFKLKRLQTDIKSATGAMGISLVLTAIYIVRALIAKNLNFYFCLYTVEFIIKSSDFSPEFKGSLPCAATAAIIVVFIAVTAVFTVLAQKKPVFLYGCLAVYGFDSVFMLIGKFSGYLSPIASEDFIDIIVHAFILAFIIMGTVSYNKLKKFEPQKTE